MQHNLKYTKLLESTGLSREDATTHIKVIEGTMNERTITKKDFEITNDKVSNLKEDINVLRNDFSNFKLEIKLEVTELKGEIKSLEYRIVNKMGVMLVTTTTCMTVVLGGIGTLLKFAF